MQQPIGGSQHQQHKQQPRQQQQQDITRLPRAQTTPMQVSELSNLPQYTTTATATATPAAAAAAAGPAVSAVDSNGCLSTHQASMRSQGLEPRLSQTGNTSLHGPAYDSKAEDVRTMRQLEQLQDDAAAAAAAAAAPHGLGDLKQRAQEVDDVSEIRQQTELHQQPEQQECQSESAAADCSTERGSKRPKPHSQRPKKPPKPQPTHFLALQVSHNPKVTASIKVIQQKLVEADEHLKPCCLDPITAHITIMVLYLPKQEHVDAADDAMADLGSVLAARGLSAPIQLQLRGLSHFKHQVLYLDVAPGQARESLMTLGATVVDHFTAAAGGSLVVPGETKPFIPHITVAKTSRVMSRHRRGKGRKGQLQIPESAWQSLAELDSGQVSIDAVQICSMQGRKAGQYYRVTHCLQLVEPAAAAAAAAAAVALHPPARGSKKRRPLEAARQRFRGLLSACACGVLKRHKTVTDVNSKQD